MTEIITADSSEVNLTSTPYRVSTITCNGSVQTNVNIHLFYEHVKLSQNCDDENFVWIELGNSKSKGVYPKKKKPKMEKKKNFENQVTVIYKICDTYAPNLKIFRNGNIQMTGIRFPEDGKRMIDVIANEIKRIARDVDPSIANVDEIDAGEFKIRMINSDFAFHFRIRRKDLHNLLISTKYNTISSFQPGTYPGVKIQYFWNENNKNKCGHCECTIPCYGRGENSNKTNDVNTKNQCKKVTISVFESGKILITGATSYSQIDEAYAYIVKIIQDNHNTLRRTAIISS